MTNHPPQSPREFTDYSESIVWHSDGGLDKMVGPIESVGKITPRYPGLDQDASAQALQTPLNFSGNFGAAVDISHCPYCRSPIRTKAGPVRSTPDDQMHSEVTSSTVDRHFCPDCGWWFVERSVTVDYILSQNIVYQTTVHEGILKRFNVDASDAPIASLRNHLEKKYDDIHYIDPTVFEKLVADIFREFFHCEARHVGRSGDDGIDVYAVISDAPCLIQVKRRGSPTRKESVRTVRELVGTCICHAARKGYVITTAPDFSRQAKAVLRNPYLKRHYIDLALVAKADLFRMLSVVQSKTEKVWETIERDG